MTNRENVDPDMGRDGGPTQTPGAPTTTGGKAGRASIPRRARQPEKEHDTKVAPTTTGDAGTGGMGTSIGGSTSDSTTSQ
jgi:hypothetical protein